MNIGVRDYVRTTYGEIFKITGKKSYKESVIYYTDAYKVIFEGDLELELEGHSKKIIDLIKKGDFVNGKEIIEVREHNGKIYLITNYIPQNYIKDEIKTILTKEQAEMMKYEVVQQ